MKIYYINLATRFDRENRVKKDFADTGLDWKLERIEAIHNVNGAIGCGQSHVKALETFTQDVLNTDEYAVIMEDDFVFTKSSDYVRRTIEKSLDFSPNIVCLGYRLLDHASYEWVSENLLELRRVFTTSCYMVKRSFVPTLIRCFKGACDGMCRGLPIQESAIDVKWIDLQGAGKKFYGIYPKIGHQMASYSDIEKRYCDYRGIEDSVVPTKRVKE